MTHTDPGWALQALGLDNATIAPLGGSMSSSAVYRVSLVGSDAVLKVTPDQGEGDDLPAARRELDFYLTLARGLPLRTPRLIDHLSSADAVVLLLTAHHPAELAPAWDEVSWLRLAGDLAALHDSPVPTAAQWHRRSWVADRLCEPDLERALRFWSRPGEAELIEPILNDPSALAQAITAPAPCFLHGDCHVANLLREEGSIVWTDWQGAGAGSPAVDLAFPSVRGVPDDAHLPQAAMLAEYIALRGLNAQEIGSAVIAAELAIFLLEWPRYASFNTDAGISRVHQRVKDLAQAWNAR